jgi:hypothetical protein
VHKDVDELTVHPDIPARILAVIVPFPLTEEIIPFKMQMKSGVRRLALLVIGYRLAVVEYPAGVACLGYQGVSGFHAVFIGYLQAVPIRMSHAAPVNVKI